MRRYALPDVAFLFEARDLGIDWNGFPVVSVGSATMRRICVELAAARGGGATADSVREDLGVWRLTGSDEWSLEGLAVLAFDVCPTCDRPAHASETDESGRHAGCAYAEGSITLAPCERCGAETEATVARDGVCPTCGDEVVPFDTECALGHPVAP